MKKDPKINVQNFVLLLTQLFVVFVKLSCIIKTFQVLETIHQVLYCEVVSLVSEQTVCHPGEYVVFTMVAVCYFSTHSFKVSQISNIPFVTYLSSSDSSSPADSLSSSSVSIVMHTRQK